MKFHKDEVQLKETGRIESFSDNVFAFALTLLVLTIKVPTIPPGDHPGYLLEQLAAQWPSYVTYVISFLTILLMWINHHNLFNRLLHSDHTLMVLNGLVLLPVTLAPFPTSLLAVFIKHPQARFAAALFAGCYVMIAGMYALLWSHVTHLNQKLLVPEEPMWVARMTRRVRLVFFLYVGTFCVAFLYPPASIVLCLCLVAYLSLPSPDPAEG